MWAPTISTQNIVWGPGMCFSPFYDDGYPMDAHPRHKYKTNSLFLQAEESQSAEIGGHPFKASYARLKHVQL